MTDARRYAPATARNKAAILNVLKLYLEQGSRVLEIASGTGEHGVFMCEALPTIIWQPSDINPEAIASINAWRMQSSERLLAPLLLNVETPHWERQIPSETNPHLKAIVNINMAHISPWGATKGLFQGASERLPQDGIVYLYGPYKRQGQHTSKSNEQFDISLKMRNPSWGIRNLEEVIELGNQYGLKHKDTIEMPANNLSIIFQKRHTG